MYVHCWFNFADFVVSAQSNDWTETFWFRLQARTSAREIPKHIRNGSCRGNSWIAPTDCIL